MSKIATLMQQAAAGAAAGELLAIEDVFSTYLYTGNSSTQTITNGIDLAGEGGLTWIKARSYADVPAHFLYDTARGPLNVLSSEVNDAQYPFSGTLTNFGSSGFSLGSAGATNTNAATYASWTFRKAPRFFDVVTTSIPSPEPSTFTVNHSLGTTVGMVIVKSTTHTYDWTVFHRSLPSNNYLILNTTVGQTNFGGTNWSSTDTTVTLPGWAGQAGGNVVIYLFAHDPLGPSGDGSDGLIACGSYTGGGAGVNVNINLGWEPQWILVKNASATNNWYIVDTMRGLTVSSDEKTLSPNLNTAEDNKGCYVPTATGFYTDSNLPVNASGNNYVYIAIRRGPMREPTSGTEVFEPSIYTGNNSYPRTIGSLPVIDLAMPRGRDGAGSPQTIDRMRGGSVYLFTSNTNAEANISPSYEVNFDNQNGLKIASQINSSGTNYVNYSFRRAPGFFDVVAYTGNQTNRTISHNLGAVPEIMIHKSRDQTNRHWIVYHKDIGTSAALCLDLTDSTSGVFSADYWNATAPTDTVFSLGSAYNATNANNSTFITYLFATLPGVSKVGSYTGNGSSQTINCGFTGGARFFLVKASSTTGDWHVFDTARGIVAGNDPYLELNTTNAEDTDEDAVDTDSTGIVVNETSASNINTSGVTYIYLAIA